MATAVDPEHVDELQYPGRQGHEKDGEAATNTKDPFADESVAHADQDFIAENIRAHISTPLVGSQTTALTSA